MKALATILVLFLAVANTQARLINDWPYSKLVEEADFIGNPGHGMVVARPLRLNSCLSHSHLPEA